VVFKRRESISAVRERAAAGDFIMSNSFGIVNRDLTGVDRACWRIGPMI